MIPRPGGSFELADGRRLSYDVVGDRDGRPVVFLHGCPGSRLSRHPDDGLAARARVRVIAIDRPGYGHSDADPASDEVSQAADVIALVDHLGIDRFAVLGWSSGGPTALALAAGHHDRVAVVGLAAAQPPMAADPGRHSPADFAKIAAEFIAPPRISIELAREAAVEGWDEESRAQLAAIAGAHEQAAASLVSAVERGLGGVEGDLRAMATPWRFDIESIAVPVMLWYGTRDNVYPPEIGRALAERIPTAHLEIVEGATHLVLLTHWTMLLDALARHFDMEEPSCR